MHDPSRAAKPDRYPGYDVLSKRSGPSWNAQTRRVVNRRLSIGQQPHYFSEAEFATMTAIAALIVPQPTNRPGVPIAGLIDHRLSQGKSDGYRLSQMPHDGEAWKQGIAALDAEAEAAHGKRFSALPRAQQSELLERMQRGELSNPAWGTMQPQAFFQRRLGRDVVMAYYAHPTAWNEIGWGGPASPRGYVRLDFNDRDPWEAAEADGNDDAPVRKINHDLR
ncbi:MULTISPECIES: gluconate 2-dehydrogenase subunit 3 family protein [Rhodopseudomonas]|uniref:Gluconate 2-dehydrogenase subunit 3 n=1 Tax=Rhodopseudomonas palustris TaxID=1076 RepID=A0A0D7F2Z9_RHOPL|nr:MULTISPECIES: gluconate 2-dehydrogenase subunit 3 family protein [Rhodopseudomonas]KIZ47231.1 gluconate 2-dehydrogenase subunit 3 [Rhodopseudomonas palustris]MDF3812611.1 gluconate 2-dehydrogenase subunit 3 family protein [Rhodopseudomonas sp. BAL398]WOK17714.1 gluconate 2-dehydrogenase subunit 3 family protein [Rhodopseudomonas sp. BAL398]